MGLVSHVLHACKTFSSKTHSNEARRAKSWVRELNFLQRHHIRVVMQSENCFTACYFGEGTGRLPVQTKINLAVICSDEDTHSDVLLMRLTYERWHERSDQGQGLDPHHIKARAQKPANAGPYLTFDSRLNTLHLLIWIRSKFDTHTRFGIK